MWLAGLTPLQSSDSWSREPRRILRSVRLANVVDGVLWLEPTPPRLRFERFDPKGQRCDLIDDLVMANAFGWRAGRLGGTFGTLLRTFLRSHRNPPMMMVIRTARDAAPPAGTGGQ